MQDKNHNGPGRSVPRSVAIIMDGNGRWAEQRGVSVAEGHRAGTCALRRVVETSIDLGIGARLSAPDLPDPDLLIRTSGESRISNFLLWQLAYSELVFLDTLWPDFGPEQLREAVDQYARRRRRFGGR